MNMKSFDRVDTEDLKSESSGNYSDDDIINKIYEMQKIYHREIQHYHANNLSLHEKLTSNQQMSRHLLNGYSITEDESEDLSQDQSYASEAVDIRKDTLEREIEEIEKSMKDDPNINKGGQGKDIFTQQNIKNESNPDTKRGKEGTREGKDSDESFEQIISQTLDDNKKILNQ